MKKFKWIASGIGILFIVTMILGMVDAYTVAPLLDLSLIQLASKSDSLFLGAFSILFMSIGVVGIAILFFPVVEEHNRMIAIAYLSARILECLLLLVGVIVYLLLLDLGDKSANAISTDLGTMQTLADLAISTRYGTYHLAMIILSIGSMLLCYSLYKSKIVPRLISVIGFIGYLLVFISAPLDILDVIDTTRSGGLLYIPGALFELFLLPIWLIFKGFNQPVYNPVSE